MPKTIILDKPVTVHGKSGPQEISEVTFRDPTPADQRALDLPFRFFSHKDGRSEVQINSDCAFKYLARLSGLSNAEIDTLPLSATSEGVEWLQSVLAPTKNSEG